MSTKNYQEHFGQRGSAYDRAMHWQPNARMHEFMQAVNAAKISAGMIVADVPAGGGYMERYLPQGCAYWYHEPCASFTNHGAMARDVVPLLPLPWIDTSVDIAISLAGVHHIENKSPFFADLYRVIKPGGRLVISDVATDSSVAQFLDGYVDAHNSTGHQGFFLDEHTLEELRQAGWDIEKHKVNNFYWLFPTKEAMAGFCHELFDLKTSTADETRSAIEEILGTAELTDGRVGMNWELFTIEAIKHK